MLTIKSVNTTSIYMFVINYYIDIDKKQIIKTCCFNPFKWSSTYKHNWGITRQSLRKARTRLQDQDQNNRFSRPKQDQDHKTFMVREECLNFLPSFISKCLKTTILIGVYRYTGKGYISVDTHIDAPYILVVLFVPIFFPSDISIDSRHPCLGYTTDCSWLDLTWIGRAPMKWMVPGWLTCQAELTPYRLHCSVLIWPCYQGHE